MAAHPAAVSRDCAAPTDAETAGLPGTRSRCAGARPAHRCARRCRTARRRRARCGRGRACSRPAIMLTMLVLPAPDGPNSAVTPLSLVKLRVERKLAELFFDVDGQHDQAPCKRALARRANHSDAISAASEMMTATMTSASAARVAARHLRQRVDRRRDGLRLARNVGDEGDGGAEFAERAGKASIAPAMMPGSASGSVTVANSPGRLAPSVAAASSSRAVDRLDRQPDRPHHQRKRHHAAGQRRAGPAEREHDAEMSASNAPTGAGGRA